MPTRSGWLFEDFHRSSLESSRIGSWSFPWTQLGGREATHDAFPVRSDEIAIDMGWSTEGIGADFDRILGEHLAALYRFPDSVPYFEAALALDPDDVATASALADDCTFDLPWQAGDLALVDNYTAMHGRRTFTGTRKVLASLVEA